MRTYPAISPEPWLQFSQIGPHFLKNHERNPIKIFMSRSSMPKSLSNSTLVVATLSVWDQILQSRLLACPYFPSSEWSYKIRLVTIFNQPNTISKHFLVISCACSLQGSKSFIKHSALSMNDGSQKDSNLRNLLQSSLEDSRNSKRFW